MKWLFHDPAGGPDYTFEINPKSGGTPPLKKKLNFSPTTAGGTIISEGPDETPDVEIQGTLVSSGQLAAFEEWANRRRFVQVTDDLGRTFTIYITEFSATRGWKRSHPYRHDWTMRYLVVS